MNDLMESAVSNLRIFIACKYSFLVKLDLLCQTYPHRHRAVMTYYCSQYFFISLESMIWKQFQSIRFRNITSSAAILCESKIKKSTQDCWWSVASFLKFLSTFLQKPRSVCSMNGLKYEKIRGQKFFLMDAWGTVKVTWDRGIVENLFWHFWWLRASISNVSSWEKWLCDGLFVHSLA